MRYKKDALFRRNVQRVKSSDHFIGITLLPEDKHFRTHSWSSSEHFLNFLSSFGSLEINFLHSFFTGSLSSSVIVFAIFNNVNEPNLVTNVRKIYVSKVFTTYRNVPSSPSAGPHPFQEEKKIQTK